MKKAQPDEQSRYSLARYISNNTVDIPTMDSGFLVEAALEMLVLWYCLPLRIFAIFTRTGHV